MKKTILIVTLALLALGVFTGVASAQTSQPATGTLHEYIEKALADKLGLPLATVESQFDAGKSLSQIALDNGITQANLYTFMVEVRSNAIKAALADGVITQAQADWMLSHSGRGMGTGRGSGMMYKAGAGTGTGSGPCGGTGIPVGTGMQRGNRWQQVHP